MERLPLASRQPLPQRLPVFMPSSLPCRRRRGTRTMRTCLAHLSARQRKQLLSSYLPHCPAGEGVESLLCAPAGAAVRRGQGTQDDVAGGGIGWGGGFRDRSGRRVRGY